MVYSHFTDKSEFITNFNTVADRDRSFDVIAGYDLTTDEILVTFRPRRFNTTDKESFVNIRREKDIRSQETFVYNLGAKRWVRMENFTPEFYGKFRGDALGKNLVSFASGVPYTHYAPGTLNYYGIQTEAVMVAVINNEPAESKVLQNLMIEGEAGGIFVDGIESNERNSFSYLPANYFKRKQNAFFTEVLRDMNSYPIGTEAYRSMLMDGKRVFGNYFLLTFVAKTAVQVKTILFKYAKDEKKGAYPYGFMSSLRQTPGASNPPQ
jgi:hypothetical protein